MRLNIGLVAIIVAGLGTVPSVLAWGAAGHEIVATIAQIYLHPSVLSSVCNILYPGFDSSNTTGSSPPCYISRVATWADQVRRQPQYRYTASLHYIGALDDHPSESCAFPGARGWAGRTDHNILGAVRNVTDIVGAYVIGERDQDAAEEALKFLIHFVGDMHMPLHLTGRLRGGNGAKITFDGRVTNLHSLWDSLLIAKALRIIPRNYTYPLPSDSSGADVEFHLRGAIYDPFVRRVMHEGFGLGSSDRNISGRFTEESQEWLSCPQLPQQSQQSQLLTAVQTVLGPRLHRWLSLNIFGLLRGDEDRWDDDVLCPYAWAKELQKLNCEFPVWPRELDEPPYNHTLTSLSEEVQYPTDSDAETEVTVLSSAVDDFGGRPRPHPDLLELDTLEYTGRLEKEWIVERLLALAGVRLAGILNGLFLGDEELAKTTTPLPVILRK